MDGLPVTAADLKNWLVETYLSREELADLMGVSKSTVDGWCSNKPIKASRQEQLRQIMLDYRLGSLSSSSRRERGLWVGSSFFSKRQWHTICQAAKLQGVTPRAFLKQAVYSACESVCRELDSPEE